MVKIYVRKSGVIAPDAIPSKSIINTLTWWKRQLKIPNEATADQAMAADQDRPTSHVDDARARLGDIAPQWQIVGNLLALGFKSEEE